MTPARAFDVYTPGKGTYGSLSFEDNWPAKGDYDMNDLSSLTIPITSSPMRQMLSLIYRRTLWFVRSCLYKMVWNLPVPANLVEKAYVKGTPGNTLIKTEPLRC